MQRKKIELPQSPLLPTSIPSWHEALLSTDMDPSQIDTTRPFSVHDRHYLFPNPTLFVTANETRRARYFATWEAIRPACLYRVYSSFSSAPPLANQQWRDMLFSDFGSGATDSKAARNRQHLLDLFGNTLEELNINIDSISASNVPHFPTVPLSESRKTLWELTELNFRFELMSLDKRASSRREDYDRQEIICQCCNTPSLLVADVRCANRGLASSKWRERLPSLLALRTLMRDWTGLKPSVLVLPDLDSHDMYSEQEVQQLEDAVARFYTQSFFRLFGRPATVPTHLP
jgi:hypothetical protein